jgi:hypothetical protein
MRDLECLHKTFIHESQISQYRSKLLITQKALFIIKWQIIMSVSWVQAALNMAN